MVMIPNALLIALATWGAVSAGMLIYHRFLAYGNPATEVWQTKYQLLEARNAELQTQLDKKNKDLDTAYNMILEKIGKK